MLTDRTAEGINWSISKLFAYESCPMQFKLRYIEKLPEPPRPPDNPLERGNRVHNMLEKYVKGKGSLHGCEAKRIDVFEPHLTHLATLYADDMATAEDDWFFNRDWDACARDNVWLWSKLDFSVTDEANGVVITGDYKTGKSAYKAVDHIQQTQLYSAVSALKYEWAEVLHAEIWYVDEGWIRQAEYTREQALKFVGRFNARAEKIYQDRLFRPNANKVTCRWCPYSPRGTGACPVGV